MEQSEMLSLLRRKEQRGLDELLRHHGPLIRYIIRGILSDEREREECCSDVTLLIWEKIDTYDASRGELVPWLTALTRNAALNRLRRLQTCEELTDTMADQTPGPEEQVLRKEIWEKLAALVATFSRTDRDLFYRKYYYLQSTEQMAAEMGLTRRGVEGRLYRLRQRLQRELGGDLDG